MNYFLLTGVFMSILDTQAVPLFKLLSTAFAHEQLIPREYTCEGRNVIPTLYWQGVPKGSRSLVLICLDPDASKSESWVHWIVYNIPVNRKNIGPILDRKKEVSDGTLQGRNSSKKIGWDGPCPPMGDAHRYFFRLYALDSMLDLKPGATKEELLDAIKEHILAETELVGLYQSAKTPK